MEETLGKRISANRKRLGMTQDRLAELLGVTAQAVSKWENDQSCPDIGTIPKLADIFGITTDELLGKQAERMEPRPARKPGAEEEDHCVEVSVHTGKRGVLGTALWLLSAGGASLAARHMGLEIPIWTLLWTTGLLIFGIFGLWPRFSAFRAGCGVLGGYYLAVEFTQLPDVGLSTLLLILGGLLLLEAVFGRKKKKFRIHTPKISHPKGSSAQDVDGESFHVSNSFSGQKHLITMDRLSSGYAENSFGELTVDLSGCKEIEEDAVVHVDCSFGQLNLQVPGCYQVISQVSSSFGSCEMHGRPDAEMKGTIYVNGSVSFGECDIFYI